jgi:phytoene synthase
MTTTAGTLARTKEYRLAFEKVEAIIRQHSKTFFFATSLLPRAQRRAIRALYAFCRATDDLVDQEDATIDDVEAWRETIRRPLQAQQEPMLKTWLLTREAFQVNPRYEDELIDGVAMDITFKPYQTWKDLADYCYHVASTVGLLSMPIIGLAKGVSWEEAEPYAIKLGIALQLTNILRDVGEDLERDRIYFPQEDLERFELTLNDIRSKTMDSRFIALMQFEVARARQLYQEALPGIPMLHPTARPAVGAAALVYRAILDEIEAIDYQVYDRRAYTSGPRKIAMLPGIFWKIARLKRQG